MHLFHLIKRMSAAAVTCIVSTVILCGNFLSAQAYTFTPDKPCTARRRFCTTGIPSRYSMRKIRISLRCRDTWHRS